MDFDSIIGQAMDLLPADWSDGARMAVLAGVAVIAFVVPALMMAAAFGKKRKPGAETKVVAASPVAAVTMAAAKPAASAPDAAMAPPGPDLNPEEWVSGNVIHFDREKAFGYIRCDRVKGHVRFQVPVSKRALRVGEKVRFKGRHGARRKPVALVVERLAG